MKFHVFILLATLAYLANQVNAQKFATPAKVNGRLTGHVTFYERELLSRQKRQGRGGPRRRPRPPPPANNPRPAPAPGNNPTAAPVTNPTPAPITNPTAAPITNPTAAPVTNPTAAPVTNPTAAPVTNPTDAPVTTEAPACGTELYRSADGSCNNRAEPSWGAKDSAFLRILDPVYREVNNDIDLYSGALHEMPVTGGVVGETYACLIGRQFENLKFGDRFWYQNAFNNAQTQQIEGQSLATVLCQTTGLESVRINAFMNAARDNPEIDCRDVEPIDYSLF